MTRVKPTEDGRIVEPLTGRHEHETQPFGTVGPTPIALAADVRLESTPNLNQLLADLLTLRDLYKKHHWQGSGGTFYPLHLLFDKHAGELAELTDAVAERVMALGGVSLAMAADVAETTLIPRPPRGPRWRPDPTLPPAARPRDPPQGGPHDGPAGGRDR